MTYLFKFHSVLLQFGAYSSYDDPPLESPSIMGAIVGTAIFLYAIGAKRKTKD